MDPDVQVTKFLYLTLSVFWGVWSSQNKFIFNNVRVNFQLVVLKVIGTFKEYNKAPKVKSQGF